MGRGHALTAHQSIDIPITILCSSLAIKLLTRFNFGHATPKSGIVDHPTIKTIYISILKWWFRCHGRHVAFGLTCQLLFMPFLSSDRPKTLVAGVFPQAVMHTAAGSCTYNIYNMRQVQRWVMCMRSNDQTWATMRRGFWVAVSSMDERGSRQNKVEF